MTNSIANIVAGKPLATGGVLMAPLGTAAPADASAAPAAAYKAAGYIGEDGLTESTDRSTSKIKAWGGDTVKILQTDFSVTYQFTFLESLNSEVLKTVYGDANVTVTAATALKGTLYDVIVNSDVLPHKVFLFEVKDGDAKIRIYVPDGQITEVGQVKYADGETVAYTVTVEAFRDATLGGNAKKMMDDGRKTA